MAAVVDQLLQYKGQTVSIEFEDGGIIDAILIDVDHVEHQDITYDVLAVRKAISEETYPRSMVYVAPIETVVGVRLLGELQGP